MLIAITGTPGAGKTAVASILRDMGEHVIDLHQYIEEKGLKERFDKKRDTYNVDADKLNRSVKELVQEDKNVFLEGHLSHFLDCDIIIVMRCHPTVLHERLRKRNYARSKITENVQAEVLDVILCESMDSEAHVFEIDNTSCTLEEAALTIKNIVSGSTSGYGPGSVNWTEEMERWC
jgi:adenylate kinase